MHQLIILWRLIRIYACACIKSHTWRTLLVLRIAAHTQACSPNLGELPLHAEALGDPSGDPILDSLSVHSGGHFGSHFGPSSERDWDASERGA